jgi:predicted glycosyltransferase involved in capsule biosynthesis
MKRTLAAHPILIGQSPPRSNEEANTDLSFIIGHRGLERLPLLTLTLNSLANQRGARVECIVVEESHERQIETELPSWVRYFHLPTETPDQPYNRSKTFNCGAAAAKGKLLVFHDNDMLAPDRYAAEMLEQMACGAQVINLKRYIFYLTELHTRRIIAASSPLVGYPEFVLQNLTGGGSLGITRDAYFQLGGFDEGFVGWGGEDVEFWDRAQILKVWNYGYLPLIHLWHAPQPEKNDRKDSAAMLRLERVLLEDRNERIARLRRLNAH